MATNAELPPSTRRTPRNTLRAAPSNSDGVGLARAFAIDCIRCLTTDGRAQCQLLNNGDIELTFVTGEIFHFSEKTVRRVA